VRAKSGAGKTVFAGLVVAVLGFVAFVAGGTTQARASAHAASTPIDVEIAIDATGSMMDAIERAQSQAGAMVTQAKALLPDIRFAVVDFRDNESHLGEYQLLQPFTADTAQVKKALGKVISKPPVTGGPASYNLAFHRSYSDNAMGWRPTARKIVVVLGDAEPFDAGGSGEAGCKDQTKDPDGLSTPTELAHMRAAERTLIMVRVHSKRLGVSLQCYQSLAAGAFVGGAARDEGGNLAAIIVELIEHAYAPVTLRPDVRLALSSGRAGYTLTLHNPNVLPVTTSAISLTLPRGFRYVPGTTTGVTTADPARSGRTLRWNADQTVPARGKLRLHVVVRATRRLGGYRGTAVAEIKTAADNPLTSRAAGAVIRVKRGIHSLTFGFSAATAGGTKIRGKAASVFRRRVRRLPAAARASGRIVLAGQGTRVVLGVRALRLLQFGAPARARLTLRVTSAPGLRGCAVGTRARLVVTDWNALRANDRTGDALVLTLPRACGGKGLQNATVDVSGS
jgi:hypothetical protein